MLPASPPPPTELVPAPYSPASLLNRIFQEDCLQGMQRIPDKSIDMILCDLPYGTTQGEWDPVIPFEALWLQYGRVIKPHGAIVLTAVQPFTSLLSTSNLKLLKYSWVWAKSEDTGHQNSPQRPLCSHEDVLVFSLGAPRYNPQKTQGTPYNKGTALRPTAVYGNQKATTIKNDDGTRYPRSVQHFKTAESEGPVLHPNQKPLALFEYMVRTYTNEGDVVLDNCRGSGTTAVACINTGRNFIGFELDAGYAAICQQRIDAALAAKRGPL